MDYKEEQDGEVETLKAIYTEEELNVISDSPNWNFEITVKSEIEDEQLVCVLDFTLPDNYPEVVPAIALSDAGRLTENQQTAVLNTLNIEAEANLEMPMVFTLVSAAQEKLQELLQEMMEEEELRKNVAEQEKLKAEEAKYKGTPVTMETFKEWKIRFLAEMEQENGFVREAANQSKGLTGRQMFEKDVTLAMSDSRFLTELDETEELKKDVEIDESLFQDLGDLDEELDAT